MISEKEAAANKKPSPFDFSTPEQYLSSIYKYQKDKEPGLSHRCLAVTMGYKSAAAFQDIIKGRVFPNEKALMGIKNIFKLDDNEIKYLALLFILRGLQDSIYKELINDHLKNYVSKRTAN